MRGQPRVEATSRLAGRSARSGVCVESEWAALREVIVGRPFLRLPCPFPLSARSRIDAEAWRLIKAREGQSLADAFPRLHGRISDQMSRAATLLEHHGVVVHEVPPFAPADIRRPASMRGRTFQYFARDPLLVVGNRVIELAIRGRDRCQERFPIRRLLEEILEGRAARRTAMEPRRSGGRRPGRRARLEGGDCLLTPTEVLVGHSGRGSNRAGIEWLRKTLDGERSVTEVPLAREAAHLDSALCLVRPGLGIRCPTWLPTGVPASLRRWRWIDITPRQALEQMAANCLPIDAATTLVPEEAPDVARALARRGQRVLTTPFSALARHGGGLRCWTQPLSRTDGDGRGA
jgi:N-dimethylarginine dimethylaminohydrolase